MEQAYQAELKLAQVLFDNHWLSHAQAKCQSAARLAGGSDGRAIALLDEIEQKLLDPSALDLSRDHAPVAILAERGCIVSTLHFRHLDSERLKQEAFRQAVSYIDIETSSQCNRKCHYCPNSTNDRLSTNHFMTESIFTSFVNDLHKIDYSRELHFVGYNEPLLFMDDILGRIVLARRLLPKATITVFTNGDFLEPEGLDRLIAAGVDELIISVHLPVNKAYSDESIFTRINKIAKRLKTPITPTAYIKDCMISARLIHAAINITIRQTDYDKLGSNRAGTLSDVGRPIDVRTAACLMPIYQFIVGHQGAVVPCCVMVSDDPRNSQYVIGKIGQTSSIFDTYCSPKFVGWRRGSFNLAPKQAPCDKCNWDVEVPLLNIPALYEPWQHLVSPTMTNPVIVGTL